MDSTNDQKPRSRGAALSRRGLLKATTALAASAAATPARAATGDIIAYVGTYTDRGRGIHMFNVNPMNGALTRWKELTGIASPSSLIFHPSKRYLTQLTRSLTLLAPTRLAPPRQWR